MRDLSDEEVRRLAGEPCDYTVKPDDCRPCRARRELARRERERWKQKDFERERERGRT